MLFSEASAKVTEENVTIFHLLGLLQDGKNYPIIKNSVFMIKYFQKAVGHPDPCKREFVTYASEGIKRICGHHLKRKLLLMQNSFNKYIGN